MRIFQTGTLVLVITIYFNPLRILTFDIEDWFHILDNPDTKEVSDWSKFESRLDRNMDLIFNILEEQNQKATFFVVGWIAENHPEQIKRIVDAGHEIGSHTHYHQLIYEQSPKAFDNDLKKSIDTLEQITGRKVKSFRAPGFSLTSKTPWAFESMLNNGIEFDCSIFPASRSHGGFQEFGIAKPALVEYAGMSIKEFPINTIKIFGSEIIFSGGGYFRLFPYSAIKKFTNKSEYVMTYFHPRDFDADQPMVPGLNPLRKFKSYYGLSKTRVKLQKWINDFEFIDLSAADKIINWENQKIINIR